MSTSRRCDYTLCTDGQWYLTLGNVEHAHSARDCTTFGPFSTKQVAENYLRGHFSNPGSSNTDDSGTRKPPTEYYSVRKLKMVTS